MIATLCDVSTACLEMTSSVEVVEPPPMSRMYFVVIALCALLMFMVVADMWFRR